MDVWLADLMPLLGFLGTWVLSLIAWRIQLIGKRRTELAEDALVAFVQAVDAMRVVRSPVTFSGEHAAMKKERGKPSEEKLPNESFRVTLWRLAQYGGLFTNLRRLQLLCLYHFGPEAGRSFDDLHHAKRCIWVAAHMGAMIDDNFGRTEEDSKLYREWQTAIWQGSDDKDEIAKRVANAQHNLETILAPHLRASAALWPLAVAQRKGKDLACVTWRYGRRAYSRVRAIFGQRRAR